MCNGGTLPSGSGPRRAHKRHSVQHILAMSAIDLGFCTLNGNRDEAGDHSKWRNLPAGAGGAEAVKLGPWNGAGF